MGAEHFREIEAYGFLLEVICGLHSRVFGETEVLGQFKTFCREKLSSSPWAQWLLEDAKLIRSKYLKDIGSHSYGSVVRRWCADRSAITILGTGQLSKKIQPWLPGARVVRSRGLAQEAKNLAATDCVVIAAPVPDSELAIIRKALEAKTQTEILWIDLRAERAAFDAKLTLEHLFKEIEHDNQQQKSILPAVRQEISRLSRSRLDRTWCRPLGWEDLV
jgi:glutamyl-tRNA reductase